MTPEELILAALDRLERRLAAVESYGQALADAREAREGARLLASAVLSAAVSALATMLTLWLRGAL